MPEVLDLREQQERETQAKGSSPVVWRALEHRQYKKTPDWYWAVGILTVGVFATAIIMQNFLFGIFALVAGFTVALLGAKPARMVTFGVSPEGVQVDTTMYPYETLKSFWIFYDPPNIAELSVESQKLIMPHIRIPLGDTNPAEVRAYLTQFLAEEQQEEPLTDAVARYLKF